MNVKAKKALNISLKIVAWLVVIFTLFIMIFTIVTVSTVDRNDRSIFGVKFYIVQTDSMSESKNNENLDIHFDAGDIVLIENLTKKEKRGLKAGDVIAFLSTNSESYGKTITHMIREVKYDGDGKLIGYVTFGTNTGSNDEKVVEPEYILGKYTGKLPGLGDFFVFVKSTPGYIVCILAPLLLLILYNAVNVVRLFRKYKKEQSKSIQAERAELAEERKKNEEALRELQALKEQLEKTEHLNASSKFEPSQNENCENE